MSIVLRGMFGPAALDLSLWKMMLATEIANRMSLEIDPRPYSR